MNLWDTTDERNVFKKYELLELLNSSEGLKVYKPENCGNTVLKRFLRSVGKLLSITKQSTSSASLLSALIQIHSETKQQSK